MRLDTIVGRLQEVRPDDIDPSESDRLLAVNLGEVAKLEMQAAALADTDEADADDEMLAEARGDVVAGCIIAACEYSEEHEFDVEAAVESRLTRIELSMKQEEMTRRLAEHGVFDDEGHVDTDPDDLGRMFH